jgi:formylglycine-generating enzyme required for sulfatase activity
MSLKSLNTRVLITGSVFITLTTIPACVRLIGGGDNAVESGRDTSGVAKDGATTDGQALADVTKDSPVLALDAGTKDDVNKDVPPAANDAVTRDGPGVPDAPVPDAPVPDASVPDAPVPDAPVPDAPVPDAPVPDAPIAPLGAWVKIAAGTFNMGSTSSEPCRSNGEVYHQVTLTRSFYIQTTEVTQDQFKQMMGYNPSDDTKCGVDCPVEMITRHEAVAYCNALSTAQGLAKCYSCSGSGPTVTCSNATAYQNGLIYTCPGFRLPTESEYEYAYRAGTTTAYYNGSNNASGCTSCSNGDPNANTLGWHCGIIGKLQPVGKKPPNPWGLYDMAGNVFAWCQDRDSKMPSTPVTDPWGGTSGNKYVMRGGSWYEYPEAMRAAASFVEIQTVRLDDIGVRCVRSILP